MKARTTATARLSALTAGKTAKKWFETTRKGERVTISPNGQIYHGTPEEVRDAALVPWRRSALAESLKVALYLRRSGTIDAAEFREMCRAYRRDAVMFGAHDESASVRIPADVFIRLQAGARLVGFDSIDDYLADLWRGELESFAEFAQVEKREIPLTRHERAALRRIDYASRASISSGDTPSASATADTRQRRVPQTTTGFKSAKSSCRG